MWTAEGRSAAAMYACKYIEVSATIDLHIDDLFVGVVRQIRALKRRCDSQRHHDSQRHKHHQRYKRNRTRLSSYWSFSFIHSFIHLRTYHSHEHNIKQQIG